MNLKTQLNDFYNTDECIPVEVKVVRATTVVAMFTNGNGIEIYVTLGNMKKLVEVMEAMQ